MISCAANGCFSDQATKINGTPISLFAFPDDNLKKSQWLRNCNLAPGARSKGPLHLCELHFERINFTASRDLKGNAVPTLFGRVEVAPLKKHKIESLLQAQPVKVQPLKKRKLYENSHTLVTPSQSPFTQLTDNIKDSANGKKTDVSFNNPIAMNGSATSSSVVLKNPETNKKIYRLTIQIDKIRSKPAPRCKKLVPLISSNTKCSKTSGQETREREKVQSLPIVKKQCPVGSCRLKKCMYESQPGFQCELCNKYYVVKKDESQGVNTCSICSITFADSQSLNIHIKKHFICDMCQTDCNSQIMYDKHVKLHVNTDSSYPYKCHQCAKVFELKESVKRHCLMEHPKIRLVQITSSAIAAKISQQGNYQCGSCNITFNNEQSYKNHTNSHRNKGSLRSNETNKVFPLSSPLTGSQIGILQPVKFSCNVCSKQFDNVGEVDKHTRTHLEDIEEDHKCNICKKLFKSNVAFSDHLKHHLSRAHPCPICSKAFINKTTLKIHLKTHDDSTIRAGRDDKCKR